MRFSITVLVVALAVWLSAIVSAGAAAMTAFGSLPRQGITVADAAAFFGDNTAEMGRFAAGRMLQGVFLAGDWVQYAAAALAVGSTVRLLRLRGLQGPRAARIAVPVLVGAAAAILAWRAWSMPAMTTDLLAYWDGVLANDHAAADAAKARFDGAHRAAEAGLQLQLWLVLAALPAAVIAALPVSGARRTAEDGFRG